jgi:hypothetical protein
MGSFNQVCALSGFPIQPGDRVKLLFLTQNPYPDGECYSHDKFFLRTIPINAVYEDCGEVVYKENYATNLICDLFKRDIVCKPMGKNQFHQYAVDKNFTFSDLLEASYQNRLQIHDGYELSHKSKQKLDKRIPTWKRVERILGKNNLKISKKEGCLGYSAIPVSKGVVKVIFHASYDQNVTIKKLEALKPLFDEKYQTKITWNIVSKDYNDEYRLLIYPKDVSILNNFEEKIKKLTSNTTSKLRRVKPLKVKRVLILETVWNAYLNCKPAGYGDFPKTAKEMFDKLKGTLSSNEMDSFVPSSLLGEQRISTLVALAFRKYFQDVPFQTSIDTHLAAGLVDKNISADQKDELMLSACESVFINYVLNVINKPWDITLHGNQSSQLKTHSNLLKSFNKIIKEMHAEQRRQEKEWEKEDE